MAVRTDTEVIIGGNVFTLTGYESADYMQRIAAYINGKIAEYAHVDSFRRQTVDRQHILLEINIADDLFKAKGQIQELEEEAAQREKEIYDLKHELVAGQIKLENTEKSLRDVQKELQESSNQVIRLETELEAAKNS